MRSYVCGLKDQLEGLGKVVVEQPVGVQSVGGARCHSSLPSSTWVLI